MFVRGSRIAAVILSRGYTLVEIQDAKVPLGLLPQEGNQYFGIVVGVMMMMLLAVACAVYLRACRRCRARIRELDREQKRYRGWQLGHLQETVAELEMEETEYLEKEIQHNWPK